MHDTQPKFSRTHRIARLLLALALTSPAVARAGTPDPAQSTIPVNIVLVGQAAGVADPLGAFTIVVRDASNNPCAGVTVKIDLANAADLAFATSQPYPGVQLVSCAPPTVSAVTDAGGNASFDLVGAVAHHSGAGIPTDACLATIVAGSTPLGSVPVAAYDLNGVDGVNADDVHLFFCDFGSGTSPAYADFDSQNGVGASDLSKLVNIITRKGSTDAVALCSGSTEPPPLVLSVPISLTQLDCTTPGTTSQYNVDPCVANKVSHLIGAVTLPSNFGDVTGVEAYVQVMGTPNVPLPGYWQLGGPGACHGTALSSLLEQDLGAGANCLVNAVFPNDPPSSALALAQWPSPAGNDREDIVVLHVPVGHYVGPGNPNPNPCTYSYGTAAGGSPINLFGLKITHNGPACASSGCSTPVLFKITQLVVTAMTSGDCGTYLTPLDCLRTGTTATPHSLILLPAAGSSNWVTFNGYPPGLDVPPASHNAGTWLAPALPNPVARTATLRFRLERAGPVRIGIYDVTGRLVRGLVDEARPGGEQSIGWDGTDASGRSVANGTYFCRLLADGTSQSRTVILRR
jgi:hypothetical protein